VCGGGALALNNFYLGHLLRSGEAQGMEYPIPADPAEMTHQGFVFIPRNRTDHLIGPALDDNRINTCKDKETKNVSDEVKR